MSTLQTWRKAYGALKDHTTLSLAQINSDYKDLDVAIVKATNHVECPPKDRHLRKILIATSAIRPRADVAYCIHALARRLGKTRNWTVALKTLIVIHRLLREGDPTFKEELLNFSERGLIPHLSNFKDDSSPIAWDCSAWVRTYAQFLEERLECFRVLKYDIETRRIHRSSQEPDMGHSITRDLDNEQLLEQLPSLQQLMYRLVGCRPEGAAVGNYVIQYALALVLKESFKIYCAINDGVINLIDKFFEMPRHEAVKALDVYRRSSQQAGSLIDFYEVCKGLELARNFQFPVLREPPSTFLETMEEYVREAPRVVSVPTQQLEFTQILQVATMISGEESYHEDFDVKKSSVGSIYKDTLDRKLEDNENQEVSVIPYQGFLQGARTGSQTGKPTHDGYGRITSETLRQMNKTNDLSMLELMAEEAWNLGITAWEELQNYDITDSSLETILEGKPESCPSWVYMSGKELGGEHVMFLPCGLAAGSAITVVGTPRQAHQEYVPQLARFRNGDGTVYVSQFMVELQGLKVVEGEAPPKILHLNPRVRGDWNRQPVVEHNTCYRMQWGQAQRCNGSPSRKDDDMLIDGFKRCEKWMSNDVVDPKGSKTTSWFNRFIGRKQKPEVTWPFPFAEGKLFILTIRAGIEGYHITVGGRHISSFPYRTGFTLEDATGLAVGGDVDVHAVYATALPTSHPSFSPQRVLEMSPDWKSHPLPKKPIHLFIGILSASNHFAERMAVRKTWMQSPEVKSSHVAVRFFVALNARKEVNAVLKKEAAYFGDIVILPFMDRYELVVLKTIAICDYGVHNVSASYIMKCDDDTFVRLPIVLSEIEHIPPTRSLYMGNLNLLHRPLRHGKWAVSYEEWPEEVYPPYANGPAYVITIDIAKFIIAQHKKQSLRLFKMEDVSMGMWVEQFNSSSRHVQYSHNWKFCQYGCMEGYYTAHYQSPRQMICLWDNLHRGRARCCNFR